MDYRHKITLTNDFHHSEVSVLVREDGYLSPTQIRRARRKLCGVAGCTCAEDIAGCRPAQVRDTGDGSGIVIRYRAAIYVAPSGAETRLTGIAQAHLDDKAMLASAMKEAERAGLITDDDPDPYPRVHRTEFLERVVIGEWAER